MSNAYIIEAGPEAAGLVIREGNRFRFVSSSHRFWSLEGTSYRDPRQAERAVRNLLTVRSGPSCAQHRGN